MPSGSVHSIKVLSCPRQQGRLSTIVMWPSPGPLMSMEADRMRPASLLKAGQGGNPSRLGATSVPTRYPAPATLALFHGAAQSRPSFAHHRADRMRLAGAESRASAHRQAAGLRMNSRFGIDPTYTSTNCLKEMVKQMMLSFIY